MFEISVLYVLQGNRQGEPAGSDLDPPVSRTLKGLDLAGISWSVCKPSHDYIDGDNL